MTQPQASPAPTPDPALTCHGGPAADLSPVTATQSRFTQALSGQTALVTGGAGFIGSHLAEALLRHGAAVTILDDLSHGRADNIPPGARFVHGSLLDDAALTRACLGQRLIFHLAALGSVPRSLLEPDLYARVNILGTQRLLEAARASGTARRVVFAASSSAYGDTETLPKHEAMPPAPLSPYAASKVAGEALMLAYARSMGLDTVSLRYFNIFGPRQSAGSAYAAVIAAFASALLAGEAPVIFGDGRQSRDFTYVANVVHANLLAATHPEPLDGAILNVATGQRTTLLELLALLAPPGAAVTPEHRPPRPGDVLHSQACLRRIESRLGYQPITPLAEGLRLTMDWFRGQAGTRQPPTTTPAPR